jgi:hypothetical protein
MMEADVNASIMKKIWRFQNHLTQNVFTTVSVRFSNMKSIHILAKIFCYRAMYCLKGMSIIFYFTSISM